MHLGKAKAREASNETELRAHIDEHNSTVAVRRAQVLKANGRQLSKADKRNLNAHCKKLRGYHLTPHSRLRLCFSGSGPLSSISEAARRFSVSNTCVAYTCNVKLGQQEFRNLRHYKGATATLSL